MKILWLQSWSYDCFQQCSNITHELFDIENKMLETAISNITLKEF